MAGYIRQSSFVDGDTITAAIFNNEYNQLVNAFSNTTGHAHDGTAAEGPVIGLIGDAGETSPNNKVLIDTTNNYIEFYVEVSSAPVQQLYIADGAIVPVTDSDVDLGTSSLYFKDTYTDTVTTTGNVTVGGNLTVTGNATISGNLTFGDADTDSINLAAEIDSDIIPNTDGTYDLGSATKEWQDLYIDGTANIDSLVADTADINGGTIDGVTIGGTTAGAVTFTDLSDGTITVTAFVDEDDMTSDSATLVPTQQSVKAYVDSQVTAQDLDFQGDTGGALSIDLDSETLTIAGGTGLDTVGSGNTVTVAIDSTVATLTDTQTLTNKTLTSPVINTGVSGTGVLDDDTFATATATTLATSESIKAYVDTTVAATNEVVEDTTPQLGGDLDLNSNDITGTGNINNTGTITTDGLTVEDGGTIQLTKNTVSAGDSLGIIEFHDEDGAATADSGKFQLQAFRGADKDAPDFKLIGSDAGGTLRTRLQIADTGDISFYEDTGTTAKLFWDASAEGLWLQGYGTSTTPAGTPSAINDAGLYFANNSGNARWGLLPEESTGEDTLNLFADVADVWQPVISFSRTTQNVGIGTTSPTQPLHVSSSSDTPAIIESTDFNSRIEIKDNSGSSFIENRGGILNLKADTADAAANSRIEFTVDGSEKLRIDSSGNVGIGTDSPNADLHLRAVLPDIRLEDSDDGSEARISYNTAGNNGLIISSDEGNEIANSVIAFKVDASEKVRIDSSGNVGIGTDSPAEILHVSDTSTAGAVGLRAENSEGHVNFTTNGGGFQFETGASGVVSVIDSSGNVGIGTTSPDRILDIEASVPAVRLTDTSTSGMYHEILGDGNSLSIEADDGNVGASSSINFKVDGSEKLRIDSSGKVYFGNQDNAASSGYIDKQTSGDYEFKIHASTSTSVNRAITFHNRSDTEAMRIDSSGQVGIGTTSPSQILHLKDSGNAVILIEAGNTSGSFINFADTDDTNIGQISYDHTSNFMAFKTNDSERLRITSSGRLGIGTSSPDSILHIEGSGIDSLRFGNIGPSGNSALRISRDDTTIAGNPLGYLEFGGKDNTGNVDTAHAYIGAIAGSHGAGDNPTNLTFGTTPNGSSTIVEVMRIDESGNVGIGTDSPTGILELSDAETLRFDLGTSGLNEILSVGSSADLSLRSGGSANVIFKNGSSESMRIDSSGNVGIGTGSPDAKLHLSGGGAEKIIIEQSSAPRGNYIGITEGDNLEIAADEDNLGASSTIRFRIDASEVARFKSSGDLLVGKTATAISSDGIEVRNNGLLVATRDSGKAAVLNRRSSDGDILEFMKDTATVGSIGVLSDKMYFAGANEGIAIDDSLNAVIPVSNTGAGNNDAVDLGASGGPAFKDLYLAGTAKVDSSAYISQGALTSSSNAVAWDAAAKANAYYATTENTTFSAPSNAVEGAIISVEIAQGGTPYTVAWNTVFEFAASTAPTVTATANKTDIFSFRYNGSVWQEIGRTQNMAQT